MTARLPTRRDEAWRYSDLKALAEVWPQGVSASRAVTVAAGETRACSEHLDGDGWRNDHVAIAVGEGGHLDFDVRQARDPGAVTTQLYEITLAAGASCAVGLLSLGSRFGRLALVVTLGEGADFTLNGAILARGEQVLEIVTEVRHAAPGATSRQLVRSVVDDRATASYLGKVAVARGAQQTDAAQSVKALLLARTATANAKPELEIYADDVKCAHGATVGELDRQALFYLASRGVDPAAARALLTRAFVADALPDAAMAAQAEAWLG